LFVFFCSSTKKKVPTHLGFHLFCCLCFVNIAHCYVLWSHLHFFFLHLLSFFLFCLVVFRSLWCYYYLMFLHDIVVHCFACIFTWRSPPQHCYSFLCLTLMFILLFEIPSSYSSTCLTFLLILFLVNATRLFAKWS
jgi:hypothetical protein